MARRCARDRRLAGRDRHDVALASRPLFRFPARAGITAAVGERIIMRMLLGLAALATLLAAPAAAEDADFYRGGWRTGSGEPEVYEFVIRGHEVSGIACTRCADGTTLARIA